MQCSGGLSLSLYRLVAGGLEAGELELHAAFKLVQQLLQQPVEEIQTNGDRVKLIFES